MILPPIASIATTTSLLATTTALNATRIAAGAAIRTGVLHRGPRVMRDHRVVHGERLAGGAGGSGGAIDGPYGPASFARMAAMEREQMGSTADPAPERPKYYDASAWTGRKD